MGPHCTAARIVKENLAWQRKKKSKARRMAMLEFLESHPDETLYEVAAEFDITNWTLREHLRRARLDRAYDKFLSPKRGIE